MSSFFLFFQLTFRLDIAQVKLFIDSLIDFIDPWHEDGPMFDGIVGIDILVMGPPNAITRVDDEIKTFLEYLLPSEMYRLTDVIFRSYGPETENEPEYTLFEYFFFMNGGRQISCHH